MSPNTTPSAASVSAVAPAWWCTGCRDGAALAATAMPPRTLDHLRLSLRQPAADRVADQLHAVAHAELAQQVRAVRLDGLLGQVQRLGGPLVRGRLGHPREPLLPP